MTPKEKAIEIIKEVRKREKQLLDEREWFLLYVFDSNVSQKLEFAADELNKVCQILESKFDTGRVDA